MFSNLIYRSSEGPLRVSCFYMMTSLKWRLGDEPKSDSHFPNKEMITSLIPLLPRSLTVLPCQTCPQLTKCAKILFLICKYEHCSSLCGLVRGSIPHIYYITGVIRSDAKVKCVCMDWSCPAASHALYICYQPDNE